MAKKKETIMTTIALVSLAALVAATQSPNGFLFTAPAAIQPLVDAGDAEINMEMPNPANGAEFAARATPQGINKALTTQADPNAQPATKTDPGAPTTAPATGASVFARAIRPMTAKKRQGGNHGATYPFDDLAAPITGPDGNKQCDGFFVPATVAKPKPWESLGSAVSAATRRYATETGKKTITVKGKIVNGVQQPDTVKARGVFNYTRKFSLVQGEYASAPGVAPVAGAWVERVQ